MADAEAHGPIDFLLVEFSGNKLQGATAAAVVDLVDRGVVRLYDLVMVRKGADGAVTVVDLGMQDLGGFAALAGARSGMLDGDDVAMAADALEPGTTGLLLVYENAWAVPFVAAALAEGGAPVASSRIPALDVIAVLDALDASA